MKIRFVRNCPGNVLLVCAVTLGAVGLVLVTYLQLGSTQQILTARSQSWNAALPVAEAGIEEALTHLNWNRGTNLASQGWTGQGNRYSKTRQLAPNGEAFYTAEISDLGQRFQITATGYQRLPLATNYVRRTIVATAVRTNLIFTKALIAKKHIRCGQGTLIDSFDSTDPNYSSNGKYVPSKAKDTASVAATSSKKNAVKVDKTKIYGDGATAPKGNFEFKNGGALGDSAWIKSGKTGAQPGKLSSDFTYEFPLVREPWPKGTGKTPTGGKYKGTDYQYILTTGHWELGKTDLSKPVIVPTNSQAVLYVTGDFKADQDIIIEQGATLILFMGGHKFEVADKKIAAEDHQALQFQYYGLPSNKEVRIKKKTDIAAVMYAPSAKIKIEGDGDAVGSFVGKCIHFKHEGQLHYDEGITKRRTLLDVYVLASWREE